MAIFKLEMGKISIEWIPEVFVGVIGFYFHAISVTKGISSSFFENLIYTAPVFAPLLFVNLAFLSGLGLLGVRESQIQYGELSEAA